MVFKVFRGRRREEIEAAEPAELLGEAKGRFVVEEVFQLMGVGLVLAGKVLRGELAAGDFLRLPDGRLLRVEGVERGHKRVGRAVAGEAAGVIVRGVGWRPGKRDLEKYRMLKAVERLRKEAERKFQHIPRETAKKFVEREVEDKLRDELEKISLEVYAARQRSP